MAKFSETIAKVADDTERMAKAMNSVPAAGSFAPIPAAPAGAVTLNTTNVTNVNLQMSSGKGGGNSSGVNDPFDRFLGNMGLNRKSLSAASLAAFMVQFQQMLAKAAAAGGLAQRTGR